MGLIPGEEPGVVLHVDEELLGIEGWTREISHTQVSAFP